MDARALVNNAIRKIQPELTPQDDEQCLYRSGYLDSFDVMQVLLEIEHETNIRLDISQILEDGVSVSALAQAIDEHEG